MPPIGGGDFVEAELLRITISSDVDDELATIKAQLSKAATAPAEEAQS
jgi:hypothetical protein